MLDLLDARAQDAAASEVLQTQTSVAGQAGVDTLLNGLRSNGEGAPTQLVLHSSPKAPVEARYGREKTLLLNPWTAEVIGQPNEGTRAFFGTVERVHRSVGLGMRNALGRGVTGAANLAFLFMLISGLYLWLPKVWSTASVKARALFRARGEGSRAGVELASRDRDLGSLSAVVYRGEAWWRRRIRGPTICCTR